MVVGNDTQYYAVCPFPLDGIILTTGQLTVTGDLVDDGAIVLCADSSLDATNLTITGQGTLQGQATSTLEISGSLLGDATNVADFDQPGTILMDGDGTEDSPQLFELMELDQGYGLAG